MLTIQEGDEYRAHGRFVEHTTFFESAIAIMKTAGHGREVAVAHGRLRIVFFNKISEK